MKTFLYQKLYRHIGSGLISAQEKTDRAIFIHVPKCAGTSICDALQGAQKGHLKYIDYQNRYGAYLNDYYTFSIVRDPFNRFKSAWSFIKNGGMNQNDNRDRLIISEFKEPIGFLEALIKNEISPPLHFQRQIDFLIAKNGRIKMNRIIKIERLDEIQNILTSDQQDGLAKKLQSIKKTNESKSECNEHFNKDLEDACKIFYEKDYEMLGYGK